MRFTAEHEGGSDALVAGVDEAGRGPLAGPVIAAAVILDAQDIPEGIDDSKRLSAARREQLAEQIRLRARAWAIGRAEVEEIDELNILQASLLAMRRAVEGLRPFPQQALIDGNRCPPLACACRAVVRGDQKVRSIAAASILAKVCRDHEMCRLDKQYPEYGFARHKGYPVPAHLRALEQHGASQAHRRSFAPVKRVLP